MNQRGEATLLGVSILLSLCGLFLLLSLELKSSFNQLRRRTQIFLCVKEAKGELNRYLEFMGRTNWGIRNLNRAALLLALIPGLQLKALSADRVRKTLKVLQRARQVSYLKTLAGLKGKGCPLDPRMFLTPFRQNRDAEGALILRSHRWTYVFFQKPYSLSLAVDAAAMDALDPRLGYRSSEKGAKLSSLLSSR